MRLRGLLVTGVVACAVGFLVLVTIPLHGTFDSERFTCGSAFHSVDQGYGGTPGLAACERDRVLARWAAVADAVVGVGCAVVLVRRYGPRHGLGRL